MVKDAIEFVDPEDQNTDFGYLEEANGYSRRTDLSIGCRKSG